MNTTDQGRASNVLGGKTARACDSCLLKRARWFCVADDAFLCQACDNSVHSANQLASRHERVRLETSSQRVEWLREGRVPLQTIRAKINYCSYTVRTISGKDSNPSQPAWHKGFTRKARTPRQAKSSRAPPLANHHHLPLVPELNSEEPFLEENDESLFCRVPVFDVFAQEFYPDLVKDEEAFDLNQDVGAMLLDDDGVGHDLNIEELLSNCDEELAEFAADVESLLGAGGGEDSVCENKDFEQGIDEGLDEQRVKIEQKDDDEVKDVIACHLDPCLDMELNWDFDCTTSVREEMKNAAAVNTSSEMDIGEESQIKERLLLRLNYEAVIAAWATQGSPWTDGIRPHVNLDEFMVAFLGGGYHRWGGVANDAGREARVSRYREKRRSRLFSKKIRYEVRKLNAEKRPRIKGRFVKRTTFSGSSLPYQLINK